MVLSDPWTLREEENPSHDFPLLPASPLMGNTWGSALLQLLPLCFCSSSLCLWGGMGVSKGRCFSHFRKCQEPLSACRVRSCVLGARVPLGVTYVPVSGGSQGGAVGSGNAALGKQHGTGMRAGNRDKEFLRGALRGAGAEPTSPQEPGPLSGSPFHENILFLAPCPSREGCRCSPHKCQCLCGSMAPPSHLALLFPHVSPPPSAPSALLSSAFFRSKA